MKLVKLFILLILMGFLQNSWAERIKDVTSIKGVRGNQLVGYGLVVGLDGTGDQTSQAPFTVQSLKNFLSQYGITLPPDVSPVTSSPDLLFATYAKSTASPLCGKDEYRC